MRDTPGSSASDRPGYVEGHHWVSAMDLAPEVVRTFSFPRPLTLYDATLRKILYTPGIEPSVDDLLFIADALEDVGVREMTLNVHWWGERDVQPKEYEVARAVLSRNFRFHVTVYPDAAISASDTRPPVEPREALALVREMGADTVELPFRPVGADGFGRELEHYSGIVREAQAIGCQPVVAIVDCARRDLQQVVAIAERAIDLAAARILLMDSFSSLSVDGMKFFCTQLRQRLSRPIELAMHVHNDFGLGTALALAAATSGVNPEVSVNSISYRAGFAALEEVAVALEVLYGVSSGIRLDRLKRLSEIVSQRTGLPATPLKPLTGDHAFLRDLPSGQLAYLRQGPRVFPPPGSCLSPAVVGSELRIVWTHHRSRSVIRAKLEQMRLSATDADIDEIRDRIDSRLSSRRTYPVWVAEAEVEAICRDVANAHGDGR